MSNENTMLWSGEKIGHVDAMLPGARHFAPIMVNGMDVTNFAYVADDIDGYVGCYRWECYPLAPSKDSKILSSQNRVTIMGEVTIGRNPFPMSP